MLNVPASDKRLIDMTEETTNDRIADLEDEVNRLSEVVTILTMRKTA